MTRAARLAEIDKELAKCAAIPVSLKWRTEIALERAARELRAQLTAALGVVEAAREGIAGMEPDKGDGAFWLGHGNCLRIRDAIAAFDGEGA